MEKINFADMSDAEIWRDFRDTEYQGTGLNRLLRAISNSDPRWCCNRIKRAKHPVITFKDGTTMRLHFCPRCGRELQ